MSEIKEVTAPTDLGVVKYQYIPRKVPGVTNPRHVLYDGKLDSAIDKYNPLRDETNRWKIKLSESEKEWLTDKLGLEKNDLNTNIGNNPYLRSIEIEIPKHGLTLDTNDAKDFLTDRVLMGYDNLFAPNQRSVKHKKSYRFVRIKEDEATEMYLEESDIKKEVYKKLGSLEESRERMVMFLLNSGMRFSSDVKTKDLRKYVNEFAEKEPKEFIKLLDDKLFVELGILNMARILKVVDVKSKMYYYDDQPLANEGSVASLENSARYLADSEQAELRLAISENVLNEFNRTN